MTHSHSIKAILHMYKPQFLFHVICFRRFLNYVAFGCVPHLLHPHVSTSKDQKEPWKYQLFGRYMRDFLSFEKDRSSEIYGIRGSARVSQSSIGSMVTHPAFTPGNKHDVATEPSRALNR